MTAKARYVTTDAEAPAVTGGEDGSHESTPLGLEWEEVSGRGDPAQRFRLYRLCECPECGGLGKGPSQGHIPREERGPYPDAPWFRCPVCRGEGRTLELVATCASPEAVGTALVTLGREGEWSECPVGVLDTEGEPGARWLVLPWLPSARNVSDAGRMLGKQSARKRGAFS